MSGPGEVLAQAMRSIARARTRTALADSVAHAVEALGLRGGVLELAGDVLKPVTMNIPEADARRLEDLLGTPASALRMPVAAMAWARQSTERRVTAIEEAFPSALLRVFPQLEERQMAAMRSAIGPGPLLSTPIEAGDDLVGLVIAWGPAVHRQRGWIEALAAQAGTAWANARAEEASPAAGAEGTTQPAPADDIRALLEPGALHMALQPIMRITDHTVMAYEALVRFGARGDISTAEQLFAAAEAAGMRLAVFDACLRSAFESASLVQPATLFVNAPMTMLLDGDDPGARIERLAREAGADPSQIVLEVTERSPIIDLALMVRVVAELRAHGFRVAIDDALSGHASMLVIAEVRPEFVKIARRLVTAIETSAARRALVVSLLSFGAHINAQVIAEGVETEAERDALVRVGVRFGQGWHLGRPALSGAVDGMRDAVEVGPGWFAAQPAEPFVPPPAPARVDAAPPPGGIRRPREVAARLELPSALARAVSALQSERDPHRILTVIAEQLQEVVPVDDLSIYAADLREQRFTPVYATGGEADETLAFTFPLDHGMTGWAFASGTPQYVPDSNRHPHAVVIPGTAADERESLLLIPLIAGDRRLGMLNCRRVGVDRFTAEDLDAAAIFGHTAATAWHSAELYAELAQRATTDPLTGLLNSRWLRETGQRELAQSRRTGGSIALLLIDLDHFKEINDTGGHAAGDSVLLHVATELKGMVRAGDAAVRLGGEEFVLLLRDAGVEAARRVAEAFHARLRQLRAPRSCHPREHITASVGIAVFPDNAATLDDLIRAADAAMYDAKVAGRNRTCVSTATRPPTPGNGHAAA